MDISDISDGHFRHFRWSFPTVQIDISDMSDGHFRHFKWTFQMDISDISDGHFRHFSSPHHALEILHATEACHIKTRMSQGRLVKPIQLHLIVAIRGMRAQSAHGCCLLLPLHVLSPDHSCTLRSSLVRGRTAPGRLLCHLLPHMFWNHAA